MPADAAYDIMIPPIIISAKGGTRTPTGFHPLDPEPSASTNSATFARILNLIRLIFKINKICCSLDNL